ncbi:Auxin response factor 17 [Olea europaea subsp. europaea]|uniref:Auxin response factor 17 n=1 Tax=Olea europaea subsp. europaea TaxID=158383 RepID=A0A8S0VAR0_OLEEU|nr:Auxin response factor 17 [Olea europaea subsp. europaea]
MASGATTGNTLHGSTHRRRGVDTMNDLEKECNSVNDIDSETLSKSDGVICQYVCKHKKGTENWVSGSRKNMWRSLFGLMLVFMVVLVFFKFHFMMRSEILIIQNFKNDLSNAQSATFDSDTSSNAAVKKRQARETPVIITQLFLHFRS